MRTSVMLLLALALLFAAGCAPAQESEANGGADRGTEPTAQPMEDAAATETPAPASPATPAAEPTASESPDDSGPVELGPTDATTSWAYLKDMYQADGTWYVVVDYIQVVGPEESLEFLNENPRLRTFPLSDHSRLMLLRNTGGPDYEPVTPEAFEAFQARSGDEIVEVTPEAGYATQVKEWWAP